MGDQSNVEVDAVVKTTVQSQKAEKRAKKIEINQLLQYFNVHP